MNLPILLSIYCVLILAASLLGGWLPMLVQLTHKRMELAASFVSGVMLGIALLHLLPHALMERSLALGPNAHGHDLLEPVMLWMLGGFLLMFVIERFFCFHHHDAPHESDDHEHAHGHVHHDHGLTWTGAAVGLTLHTLVAGVGLAASAEAERGGGGLWGMAGFGTFLVIFLHKPFDSLTIGTLMAKGDRPRPIRHVVNLLFALVIPLGVLLFYAGLPRDGDMMHLITSSALAFATGTFLCIALSDLLPELQFHHHDRVKLTIALLLGLLLAWGIARLEASSHDHGHDHAQPPAGATPADPHGGHDHDHDGHDHALRGPSFDWLASLDPVGPTAILTSS